MFGRLTESVTLIVAIYLLLKKKKHLNPADVKLAQLNQMKTNEVYFHVVFSQKKQFANIPKNIFKKIFSNIFDIHKQHIICQHGLTKHR